MMANSYNWILKEYPEYITKEQLYQICRVSKKTALYYLESGLIPCTDNGKKTHRFTISTEDVIAFLKKRDKEPKQYNAQPGWYGGNENRNLPYRLVRVKRNKKTEVQLTQLLKEYPDLLKPVDVSKVTGYSQKTVFAWCKTDKLHHFEVRKAFLIPKLSLLDFMMSDKFKGIKVIKENYHAFWKRYTSEINK